MTGKSITTYKSNAQGDKPRTSAGSKEMTDNLKRALLGVKSKVQLDIEVEDNNPLSNAMSPRSTMKPKLQQTPLSSRHTTRQSISGLPNSMMSSLGKGGGLSSSRNSIIGSGAQNQLASARNLADGRKTTMAMSKDDKSEEKTKPSSGLRSTIGGHRRPGSNMGLINPNNK